MSNALCVVKFKSTCLYAIYIKATFKAIDLNCRLCICKLIHTTWSQCSLFTKQPTSGLTLTFIVRGMLKRLHQITGRQKVDLRRRWNIHLAQISSVWILLYFNSTTIKHRLRLDLLADTRFRFLKLLNLDGKQVIFLSSYFV